MKSVLHIGTDLSLPLDCITQTFGILAVRGAGKSNLAAAMAEEMYTAKLPFVVIDPVGSWFGLRSSGDGKGAGLEIPIFGGRHGDVPLERGAGVLLADLIAAQRMTCVLDVSEFSEGDKIKFLIDFAERLYRKNTEPLHLFLEEADDYAPQRPFRDQARLLGAWENIVRRGRARGLGITMITQRSASLNKNVLTQIETLFVLRTTSPQDRAAIEAWVKYQGGAPEMLKTLPELAAGEAWVWSPSWLKTFRRVHVRRRWTFDSAATPKELKGKRAPATLADVDLGAIRESMADTIEKAKQEDPKELRKTIAEMAREMGSLKTELEQAKASLEHANSIVAGQAKRIAKPAELQVLDPVLIAELGKVTEKLQGVVDAAWSTAAAVTKARDSLSEPASPTRKPPLPHWRTNPASTQPNPVKPKAPRTNGHATITEHLAGGERKILTALAQYPGGRTKIQVAILTGYAHSGGGFNNYLSSLRGRGLLEGSDNLRATDAGLAALGDFEPLPTGAALLAYWCGRLGKAERLILEQLCEQYPNALTKDSLGTRTGYEPNGGGFNNALSKLRTLELISGRGELRASEDLFG